LIGNALLRRNLSFFPHFRCPTKNAKHANGLPRGKKRHFRQCGRRGNAVVAAIGRADDGISPGRRVV